MSFVNNNETPQTKVSFIYIQDLSNQTTTVEKTDAKGNISAIEFDFLGRPVANKWKSSAGFNTVCTTEYNVKGNIEATLDALGSRIQYQYDGLGRQTKIILPNVAGVNPNNPDKARICYGGENGLDITLSTPSDYTPEWAAFVKKQNPDGNYAYQGYDILGRLIWAAEKATSTVLDQTWYKYDVLNRLVKVFR